MTSNPELFRALAEPLGWALLHSLWQGTLLAALLALALRLIPRSHAALRHAVCLLALAALSAAFGLTASRISRPAALAAVAAPASSTPALDSIPPRIAPDIPLAGIPSQNGHSTSYEPSSARKGLTGSAAPNTFSLTWRARFELAAPWLSAAWALGVLLLWARQLGGWWRVRGLRSSAKAARPEWQQTFAGLVGTFGVNARVCLLESGGAVGPMLVGLLRPAVILPARLATGLSATELKAILAHELAHLARRDAWSNLAQVAVETLFFYHPAVWWIGACARRERECAADDLALHVCTDRRAYAGALAHLAEIQLAPSPALAATGGDLLGRIRRIVRQSETEPASGTWSVALPVALTALVLGSLVAARAQEENVIVVSPGASIQQAIDTAPQGAVIRLEAGEWKERIVISKPLTLEGAGWERTRLTIEEPSPEETGKVYPDLDARRKAAVTPEEKRAAATEWVQRLVRPAIWVRDAKGVTLRKLRVQGVSERGRDTGGTSSTLVHFQNAKAVMTDCAVVGPFGNGIQIADESDVEIRGTLVAAIWNNGIVVYGRGGRAGNDAPSRLHLVESEVRNVYHYGIAIGGGCDTTRIERCRISGTAWHGIRYDDASPTILGNTIFANARCGIYASGATKATVRGNVFWKNEMDGVSCWFANADTLEGNTFVGNLREGLSVIGGAKPRVARNIFTGNPVAVVCGATSGRNGEVSAVGDPVLEGNLFSDNKIVIQRKEESQPAPSGSVEADPQFRAANQADFALAAASPARSTGIGAADPLPPIGPWPLLAEEKAIIPADDTREWTFWTAPGATKPSKKAADLRTKAMRDAQALVTDAFQLNDAQKRSAAIDRIRTALESGDLSEVRMALAALQRVQKVEFDKESFRPALRRLLTSPEPDIRKESVVALGSLGANAEDLNRAVAMVADPSADVRFALPGALALLSNRDLTGAAGNAALKLLDGAGGKATRDFWHSMWGTKISPELEQRVVAASRSNDQGTGYSDVFYYALTVHLSKREPTVTRLIELADSSDPINVGHRVLWGLRQGVEKDQQPRVVDLALKVIAGRSDESLRKGALDLLRDYATVAQAAPIKELLAKPGITGEFRQALEGTLAQLEPRTTAETSSTTPAPNSTAAKDRTPDTVQVSVDGTIKWNGQDLSTEALGAELKVRAKQRADYAVTVHAGKDVDYKSVLKVLDLCREANIQKVALTAEAAPQTAQTEEQRAAAMVEKNRQAARIRAAQDQQHYMPEQLREIETLYQVANTKGKRSEEARASLKQLLEKYDKANRTGCATLYLGQASEGAERLDYLTRAVEKFSDCYYFNGCQVGGYGRYVLALTLWEKGEKEKARQLITELKTTLKEATDHSGRPITFLAEEAEKIFAAQP